MKTFAFVGAALMLLAATASADELAVSDSTLRGMGLGGMQVISDSQGDTVRGKGTYAAVWGGSRANFLGQHSNDNYKAGAAWIGKDASAGGGSISFAGKVGVFLSVEASLLPPYLAGSLHAFAVGGVSGGGATAWAN